MTEWFANRVRLTAVLDKPIEDMSSAYLVRLWQSTTDAEHEEIVQKQKHYSIKGVVRKTEQNAIEYVITTDAKSRVDWWLGKRMAGPFGDDIEFTWAEILNYYSKAFFNDIAVKRIAIGLNVVQPTSEAATVISGLIPQTAPFLGEVSDFAIKANSPVEEVVGSITYKINRHVDVSQGVWVSMSGEVGGPPSVQQEVSAVQVELDVNTADVGSAILVENIDELFVRLTEQITTMLANGVTF